MSSSGLLKSTFLKTAIFNKLQTLNLGIISTTNLLKSILLQQINIFNNSGVKNCTQSAHVNTETGEFDVIKEVKIGNKEVTAVNTISCFVRTTGKKLEKIDNDTYLLSLKNDYDVTMYTTYTKQNRVFNQNFKVEDIKDCSEYMIKNGTNCILSLDKEKYIFLVNVIDGHFINKENDLVGYKIKPLINLTTKQGFNTVSFKNEDHMKDELNHDVEMPLLDEEFSCTVNINKSIFNCPCGGGCIAAAIGATIAASSIGAAAA